MSWRAGARVGEARWRGATADPGGAAGASGALTVAALLRRVEEAIAQRVLQVHVRGELSGVVRAASGHLYFNLKDAEGEAALLRCAMFRRSAALLDFQPREGQQVELRGRLAIYTARGELQCVAEAMRPLGAGQLYEQFLKLKARLEQEGLFDPARRLPLPTLARSIGVVTSPSGAALHDVLTAMARRAPHVQVGVHPTLVQGPEAPAQIVEALRRAADPRWGHDLLILCRGGGSLEDLWAFNDERVVRAVDAATLPTIVGVGHETDLTLAELAADLRAPTPTAAAELAAPRRADLLAGLKALDDARAGAMQARLDREAQRIDRLGFALGRPQQWLSAQQMDLQRLGERLRRALGGGMQAQQQRLERLPLRGRLAWQRPLERAIQRWQAIPARLTQAAERRLRAEDGRLALLGARLAALDPAQVLSRGYVWIVDASGRPVVSSRQVAQGDALTAHWADGDAAIVVTELRPEAG